MKTRDTIPQGLFLIILLCGAAIFVHAQEETPATREISSVDFQNQRQKASGGQTSVKLTTPKLTLRQKKNIAVITSVRRKYNLVKRIPPKAKTSALPRVKNPTQKSTVKSEQIGVTFWRLRPITADDGEVPVFSVKVGDGREDWTAERVNSTTKFKIGDRLRFTIESSRTGYLYIINREYYTDGSTGTANIIFPTLRTRGGDNHVGAGSLVDVPSSTDSTTYFTIKPKRADYAGEELVVLITKEKLPLDIGMKPIAVNAAQLEKWSDEWGATVDIYDAEDGEGVTMTNTEMITAQTTSRALEQEEPLPQTIYKVQISSEMPLFVPFRMSAVSP
jgi:hypothetical protein